MTKCWIAMCFSAVAVSAALAQQVKAGAILPPPIDVRPSLETVKVLQAKLNGAPSVEDVAYVRDNVTAEDSIAGGIKREIAHVSVHPDSINSTVPALLTVRTAALMELHEMRQNAVKLCLQLPSKYRTRLPECAEIFKHEIRLEALAKENK